MASRRIFVAAAAACIFFAGVLHVLCQEAEGRIIAHRGASGLAPENTLAAVHKALESRADMIEIDIRQTRDNVLVLMHDDTIDRTTNGTGRVCEMLFTDIQQFSAGAWYDSAYAGERVPKLTQVLDAVNGESELLIEIKGNTGDNRDMGQRLVDMLHAHNAVDWCIVQSFDDTCLKAVHELDSTIVLYKLLVTDLPFINIMITTTVTAGRIDGYRYVDGVGINRAFATIKRIKRLKKLGFCVHVWTVNDTARAEAMFRRGADGIITDNPQLFISGQPCN